MAVVSRSALHPRGRAAVLPRSIGGRSVNPDGRRGTIRHRYPARAPGLSRLLQSRPGNFRPSPSAHLVGEEGHHLFGEIARSKIRHAARRRGHRSSVDTHRRHSGSGRRRIDQRQQRRRSGQELEPQDRHRRGERHRDRPDHPEVHREGQRPGHQEDQGDRQGHRLVDPHREGHPDVSVTTSAADYDTALSQARSEAKKKAHERAKAAAIAEAKKQAVANSKAKARHRAKDKAERLAFDKFGKEVIADAAALKGTPYRWGGTSKSGFDCSGYVAT